MKYFNRSKLFRLQQARAK